MAIRFLNTISVATKVANIKKKTLWKFDSFLHMFFKIFIYLFCENDVLLYWSIWYKYGVNNLFNTFIQQGRIQLNKSDSKDIYNITRGLFFK